MERFKRFSLVASSLMLVLALVTVLGTKEVRAVVATMVQVANTANAPAVTSSIDDPGRIPYTSQSSNNCTFNYCQFTFPPVPAGHRLVIQHVTAQPFFTTTPGNIVAIVQSSNGPEIQFKVPTVPNAAFDQPVLVYVNGGDNPVVQLNADALFSPFGQSLVLVGYELDCNVAHCAPIATQ